MYTTEEEIFRCLNQFLTHLQINWQKYKLAIWTVWKQWQGKNSAGRVHVNTMTKVSSNIHGRQSGRELVIKKYDSIFQNTLHHALQIVSFIKE